MEKIEIGNGISYNANCLDVLATLPPGSVDLTVTSPPYDGLRHYKGYCFPFEEIADALYQVTAEGGVVVWVVNDGTDSNGSRTGSSLRQCLYFHRVGFNIHDYMIWNKGQCNGIGSLATRYMPVTEFMFILSKGRPKTFNPLKDRPNLHAGSKIHAKVREANGELRRQKFTGETLDEFGIRFNVWQIHPRPNMQSWHPAKFPPDLARDHIISWSNPGDTVLDPFGGSMTTAQQADLLNRKWISCEISEEYFKRSLAEFQPCLQFL